MNTKLKEIIKTKGKICIALDFREKDKILEFIKLLSNEVSIFKIHCDIIDNFDDDFINMLIKLKNKHNFLIWEDRKFSDIGYIVNYQVNYGVHKISQWADIITCHSTCGSKSIPEIKNIIIFLVIELSCVGNLCDSNYIEKSVEIANNNDNILGVVCQHNPLHLNTNILKIVPGISTKSNLKDNFNQKYNNVSNRQFADIFVVGRAITNSKIPLETLKQIKNET